MYRRFATRGDEYLIDNSDITVSSLLFTNGVTTPGTSDTVTHLNGSDLLPSGEQYEQYLERLFEFQIIFLIISRVDSIGFVDGAGL